MRKLFLPVEDFPGGIGNDIYRATIRNDVLIDVSIWTHPEEVWAAEEPTEDNPEPEKKLVGWNVDVAEVGCACRATKENGFRQFGYAAKKLGIEINRDRVMAAMFT